MTLRLTPTSTGTRIELKVVPGASRDRVMGVLGDALKIAVSKPPSGGAANAAVVAVLAKAFGVREANVTIVSGHASPRKKSKSSALRGMTSIGCSRRLEHESRESPRTGSQNSGALTPRPS